MAFPFAEHVGLLSDFLTRRLEVVDAIEQRLLNVRDKELARRPDRQEFGRRLNSCFYELPRLPRERSQLRGQLSASHVADGFEPMRVDGFSNELDPLHLIARAHWYWQSHRWPGKSGRVTFAQTVFAVFILRQLEPLSLRIWDAGYDAAASRLQEVQALLDRLNGSTGASVLARDAGWLIQTAQGPLTRYVHPYLTVSEHISESLSTQQRAEVHSAGAKLAGGHLRSQLRYRVWENQLSIDDPDLAAFTRSSNSMDYAVLLRDLVPLLERYERAAVEHDDEARLRFADAILQGLSADPELFVTRLDVLAPSVTIEALFVERGDGAARLTPRGIAHGRLIERYGELIGTLASSLSNDAGALDPAGLTYSPFGVTYGFCADLLSNMAQDTLLSHATFGLSFEDVFESRGNLDDKLARARGWEALPTREGEQQHFEHSLDWAQQMFARLTGALNARSAHPRRPNASERPDVRMFVSSDSASAQPRGAASAQEHCTTSDVQRAAAGAALLRPKSQMLNDRNEARFLASAETEGKWFGISKVVLTLFTAQGTDAQLTGVPASVVEILRLLAGALVVERGGRS